MEEDVCNGSGGLGRSRSGDKGDESQSKEKVVSSVPLGYISDMSTWSVFSGRLV